MSVKQFSIIKSLKQLLGVLPRSESEDLTTIANLGCVPLNVHNAQNILSAVPHDDHGRYGRGENVIADVINFAHTTLTTTHLSWWVVVDVRSLAQFLNN